MNVGSGKERSINTNISERDLGYIAAIFDTMGSFYVGETNPTARDVTIWECNIQLSSSNESLIKWFNDTLFCNSSSLQVDPPRGRFKRSTHSIQIGGKVLDFLLPRIKESLLFRREYADLFIIFRSTMNKGGPKRGTDLADEIKEQRRLVVERVRQLNGTYKKVRRRKIKNGEKYDGPQPRS